MTESMDPTIPPKTYILVEKVSADEVEVGDVVVFISEDPTIYGQYNTHRVIEKDGDKFVTKGDNPKSPVDKYPATAQTIVGRYVRTMPVMTFMGRVVMTPVGFAALIVVFMVSITFCVIPDLKQALADKNKEDEEVREREKRRLIEEEIRRLKESETDEKSDK